MKLKIEIDLENDAFRLDPLESMQTNKDISHAEVKYVVNQCLGALMMRGSWPLKDSNGNTVGKAEIVEDQPICVHVWSDKHMPNLPTVRCDKCNALRLKSEVNYGK